MHKDPVEYLKHILDECRLIQSVITPELQKNDFLEDETLKRCYTESGDYWRSNQESNRRC